MSWRTAQRETSTPKLVELLNFTNYLYVYSDMLFFLFFLLIIVLLLLLTNKVEYNDGVMTSIKRDLSF